MSKVVIYNGQLVPGEKVLISPVNRGMMYGDGCFDTLRSYKGKFLNLEDHFGRTKAAADYLGIEVPFDLEGFKSKILELLYANKLINEDAMVRVQCWREGSRGYATDSVQGNWLTTCASYLLSKAPISLATVEISATPFEALDRRFKLSNGLNYIQAAREAQKKGADDALMFTVDRKISETTVANIFWIKGNTFYTPSLRCDLFPGITRGILINAIREIKGMEIIEGEFEVKDIKRADAVFVTNSLKEINAVYSIDGVKYNIAHPLIGIVEQLFELYKKKNLI